MIEDSSVKMKRKKTYLWIRKRRSLKVFVII
jgi:hypothetical protein